MTAASACMYTGTVDRFTSPGVRGTPRRAPPEPEGDALREPVVGRPDAAAVLRLQRTAGNGAVSALMAVQRAPEPKAEELGIDPMPRCRG